MATTSLSVRDLMQSRINSLPASLRDRIDYQFCYLPTLTTRELRRCATLAKELTEATGGAVDVTFNPASQFSGDVASKGQLFYAWLCPPAVGESRDAMCLDARQPDLRGQLAAELRRVAGVYLDLAAQVESQG